MKRRIKQACSETTLRTQSTSGKELRQLDLNESLALASAESESSRNTSKRASTAEKPRRKPRKRQGNSEKTSKRS